MRLSMRWLLAATTVFAVLLLGALPASADTTAQSLPLGQNWSNTGLITTNNDWSGVPGVIGYRGDGLTSSTGVNPQTVVADGSATPVNVIANQANPNTLITGGIAEFDTLPDPVVALQGSGTARAPHLVFTVVTTGLSNITVAYNLRDVDGSTDNAIQPVALQYRVGTSGSYTNVPAGFVADATTGPSLATLVTPVSAVLPANANNQTVVQVRVITTDAAGSDEWVGVDDISITAVADQAPQVQSTTPGDGAADVAVDSNITITFSEPVDVTDPWFTISCPISDGHAATVAGGPTTFTLDPLADFASGETCTVTIAAASVADQDANDPPNNMDANYVFSFTTGTAPPPPNAHIVVSQVYGGGGNTGATLKNDFIELFNRGNSVVNLTGWSVQYASATGTTWQRTNLSTTTLQPGQYYLVKEAQGTGGTVDLPTPDAAGSIAMSATSGKVALVTSTTTLAGGCPSGGAIIDFVGYGSAAACYEGSGPTATLSNTAAALRDDEGCTDTDDNASDFSTGAPSPRNTASPFHRCDAPRGVGAASPSAVEPGGTTLLTVAVTPGTDPTSTGIYVTCNLSAIGGFFSQLFYDDGTNGDVTAGDNTFSYTATVAAGTSPGAKSLPCTVSDAQARSSSLSIGLTVLGPPTPIHDIQGAAHVSPMLGQTPSNVPGIVTALRTNGFYMQDPSPDANDATSEGIFVFTGSPPTASVGDSVSVSGTISEFRPGGAANNLSTTELTSPSIFVLSTGNALPATTVIGSGGRIPPTDVIDDDATGDVETSGSFDAATDGIDFYESLEGMRVQVNNPVAAGPTNSFGELPVLADDGAGASVRTARGGIVIRANDFNPERITLDDQITLSMPMLNVGDHLDAAAVGVMDYNFGLPMIELTALPGAVHDGVTPESTGSAGVNQLAVATFNVENLDPGDPPTKFARLAGLIANNLASPDVIAVEEVQDNNGELGGGGVDANVTLDTLISAIQAAGGPTYDYRQINPVDGQDGGAPGGNIRQVFLFRTDRGLSFIDRPGGTSTVGATVVNNGGTPELTFSPGRIDPTNAAFNASRKPLAGEFMFHGQHLFVIANHFNSKGGDQPLFGRFQPPGHSSEVQRHNQATVENNFIDSILALDPNANIITAGDFNDFEFSQTIDILKGGSTPVLHDLIDSLPQNQRYSYEFEGNAQVLDHILTSNSLFARPFSFDAVHVNAEFADQASDHDPSVALITLNDPPTVSAGGPYAVDEGGSVLLAASGTDPEGGPLSYAWDLDDNGSFETPGQSVSFSAALIDGPATPTVRVQVTDDGGLSDIDEVTVSVLNVAPSATFEAPATAFAGLDFTVSLTSPSDPAPADTFTYAFDCGAGYGPFGSASSASCASTTVGDLAVRGKIADDDGGVTEYSATVHVVVTFDSLCTLTRQYSSDPQAADVLCAKLAAAAGAPDANSRAGHLKAYRNQVDAKTGPQPGKAFTEAEGAVLKELSTHLT